MAICLSWNQSRKCSPALSDLESFTSRQTAAGQSLRCHELPHRRHYLPAPLGASRPYWGKTQKSRLLLLYLLLLCSALYFTCVPSPTDGLRYLSDFPHHFQTRETYLRAVFKQLRSTITRDDTTSPESYFRRMNSAAFLLLALMSAGTLLQGKPR